MAKGNGNETPEEKLKALSALFNDEGVPCEATDYEEDFVCDLVDSLILAEEAGGDFKIYSEKTAEKIAQIYRKYETKGWL